MNHGGKPEENQIRSDQIKSNESLRSSEAVSDQGVLTTMIVTDIECDRT